MAVRAIAVATTAAHMVVIATGGISEPKAMSDGGGSGCAVIAFVGLIWFGWHQYDRANDAEKKLESARAQIEELRTKTDTLETASDNLKAQMDRFSSENWRDVMPDAQSAADDVDSAKDDLSSSASDAEE
jgi:hypothetical protein